MDKRKTVNTGGRWHSMP